MKEGVTMGVIRRYHYPYPNNSVRPFSTAPSVENLPPNSDSHFKFRSEPDGLQRTRQRTNEGLTTMNSLYYDDLSAADSSSGSSDEERELKNAKDDPCDSEETDSLWSRCIVHLDVDCFYCQCEEIDGPPQYKQQPLAIGQKHIIVTSNYIARKHGVKKLQLRTEAYRACPSLLILEGSDLERYRQHSRRIYQAFRDTLSELCRHYGSKSDHALRCVSIRKGGMDELFADVTGLVRAATQCNAPSEPMPMPANTFVYGEYQSDSEAKIVITEDQSGAQACIGYDENIRVSSRENSHVNYGQEADRVGCRERLHVTASLCEKIRQQVRQRTGFTSTIGVSVSPMLAKLTSDLRKPDSLNVLYPWRSSGVVLPMPLRKVPELGHRTLKALQPCLHQCHAERSPDFWTCWDLLQCSQCDIARALQQVHLYEKTSDEIGRMLLQKCRGVDSTQIVDDEGGIPKTVSVENSFKRDTMRTRQQILDAMEELFLRLPKLLDDRKLHSDRPNIAFPTTIRLTARTVDRKIHKRRPFVTHSRQCRVDGAPLVKVTDSVARCSLLRKAVNPLLETLVFSGSDINVTRLNIALTNFQDVGMSQTKHAIGSLPFRASLSLRQKHKCNEQQHDMEAADPGAESWVHDSSGPCPEGVDPSVFAELPPKIAAEVLQAYRTQVPTKQPSNKKAKKTIDCFFVPTRKSF